MRKLVPLLGLTRVLALAFAAAASEVPPQAADVGRLVLFVSGPEDEESDVLFQAGKFNFGPFPQVCDVLADLQVLRAARVEAVCTSPTS